MAPHKMVKAETTIRKPVNWNRNDFRKEPANSSDKVLPNRKIV